MNSKFIRTFSYNKRISMQIKNTLWLEYQNKLNLGTLHKNKSALTL